jgi:hypothetical protein
MGHHDLLSKMSTLNYVSDDAETIPWFNEAELEDDDEAGRDGVASGRGGEAVTVAARRRPPPVPTQPLPTEAARSTRVGAALRDEGEIARGGMGSIHKLYDPDLRRHIALKVHPTVGATRATRRRFVDEARITGQLDHPNIVPVHDLALRPARTPATR